MTKKTIEPDRVYASGFYLTKEEDGLYKIPQGLADRFAEFNNQHLGLRRTLEDLAAFVASERGRLVREQNALWHTITDSLGLPRGANATIDNGTLTLRIAPLDERTATLKIETPDIR